MRAAGTLILGFLIAIGQLTVSYTVCRSFMAVEESCSAKAPASKSEGCRKMCELGQENCPVVLQTAKTEFSLDATKFLGAQKQLLLTSALYGKIEFPLLEIHARPSPVDVYLLNRTLLI